MGQAVFEIKKNPVGRYYFVFRDMNGMALATSISFSGRSQLEKCLAYLRDTVQLSEAKETEKASDELPLFKINSKNGGGYDFSLIGFDGFLILTSECFPYEEDCLAAIETLKNQSCDAGIADTLL